MLRLVLLVGLIAGVGWWTAETESGWHRPGASATERSAALAACRAEATSGLHGVVAASGHSLERCMTGRGWAPGEAPATQVAALR